MMKARVALASQPSTSSGTLSIAGLDSLRIILALIVAFSHGFGIDFRIFMDKGEMLGSTVGSAAWLVAGNLYNGQAAVIVFFLISGFVIHYPYAKGRPFEPFSFLTGRLLRIGLPLAVVLVIAGLAFEVRPLAYTGIWSLGCELIYYLLYPLLRRLRELTGSWTRLYLLALVVAALVLGSVGLPEVSEPGRLQDFPIFGHGLTWLTGLPIWILGCHAAESDWGRLKGARTLVRLWVMRVGVLGLSVLFGILKFHGDRIFGVDVPNWLSLHLFAVAAYFWMRWEIQWHFKHPPSNILEWGGVWSYSLYIVHPLLHYALLRGGQEVAEPTTLLAGLASATWVVVAAYIFYRLIELPSHCLAKSAAIEVQGWFRARLGGEQAL